MSKSRGNVVNPDAVVREYGADSLRLYEMFMGPLEATKPWSMEGVNGVRGFLDRVWRMIVDDRSETLELNAAMQRRRRRRPSRTGCCTRRFKAVTQDLERMAFNTAIAKMMEFTNYFTKSDVARRRPWNRWCCCCRRLRRTWPRSCGNCWGTRNRWPTSRGRCSTPAAVHEDSVEVPVQINGKLRGRVIVPSGTSKADLEKAAREDARIAELLAGQTVVKVIAVEGKMVNFVTK